MCDVSEFPIPLANSARPRPTTHHFRSWRCERPCGNGRGRCTPREPCQRVKCPPCGCRRKTSGRFCLFKCLHNVESCQSRPLFELRARVFVLIVGALKSGEGSEYVLWGVCVWCVVLGYTKPVPIGIEMGCRSARCFHLGLAFPRSV